MGIVAACFVHSSGDKRTQKLVFVGVCGGVGWVCEGCAVVVISYSSRRNKLLKLLRYSQQHTVEGL